ncbi:hypothetical protein A0T30_08420 [Aquipseudomonas alcaligenes]|nr:hypothetical protein A0T30_08420 [Pseudomonas alcaligenes]
MLAFFYRCVLFFVKVKVSVWFRAVGNDAQDWVGLAASIKIPDICLKGAIFSFANLNALYFIVAGQQLFFDGLLYDCFGVFGEIEY